MSHKIILSELEKCLFPELYPLYNVNIKDELNDVRNGSIKDKTGILNIAYKIKVVQYCCMVKDANARYILNNLFNKHIENYLDWQRAYDWYQLKSILMFFMVFSGVRNEKEFVHAFENKNLPMIFAKYVPRNIELKSK